MGAAYYNYVILQDVTPFDPVRQSSGILRPPPPLKEMVPHERVENRPAEVRTCNIHDLAQYSNLRAI